MRFCNVLLCLGMPQIFLTFKTAKKSILVLVDKSDFDIFKLSKLYLISSDDDKSITLSRVLATGGDSAIFRFTERLFQSVVYLFFVV